MYLHTLCLFVQGLGGPLFDIMVCVFMMGAQVQAFMQKMPSNHHHQHTTGTNDFLNTLKIYTEPGGAEPLHIKRGFSTRIKYYETVETFIRFKLTFPLLLRLLGSLSP